MEEDELVSTQVYGEKPPIKVVYSLTAFGRTFIPVLNAVLGWGNQVAVEKGEFVKSAASNLISLPLLPSLEF